MAKDEGCGICGAPEDNHVNRWHETAGFHAFEHPTETQVYRRQRDRTLIGHSWKTWSTKEQK